MTIDRSHLKWMLAVLLAGALAMAIYLASPYPAAGSSKTGLLFGLSAVSSMGFAALLPLGKRLTRWRIGPLRALQRGHIWLGLLSLPLVLFHGGFRTGGPFTTVLLILLGAILLTGLFGLLFLHQLPLGTSGKSEKSKTGAALILFGHRVTLLLHIPLAVALLVLVVFHAVMSLYF